MRVNSTPGVVFGSNVSAGTPIVRALPPPVLPPVGFSVAAAGSGVSPVVV